MMSTEPVEGVGLQSYQKAYGEGQITDESVLWVTHESLRGATFLYKSVDRNSLRYSSDRPRPAEEVLTKTTPWSARPDR